MSGFYLLRKCSSQLKVEEFFLKHPFVQNSRLWMTGTSAHHPFYPFSVSAKPCILLMLLWLLTSRLFSKCAGPLHPTLPKWWVFQVSSSFMLLPLVSPTQHTQAIFSLWLLARIFSMSACTLHYLLKAMNCDCLASSNPGPFLSKIFIAVCKSVLKDVKGTT